MDAHSNVHGLHATGLYATCMYKNRGCLLSRRTANEGVTARHITSIADEWDEWRISTMHRLIFHVKQWSCFVLNDINTHEFTASDEWPPINIPDLHPVDYRISGMTHMCYTIVWRQLDNNCKHSSTFPWHVARQMLTCHRIIQKMKMLMFLDIRVCCNHPIGNTEVAHCTRCNFDLDGVCSIFNNRSMHNVFSLGDFNAAGDIWLSSLFIELLNYKQKILSSFLKFWHCQLDPTSQILLSVVLSSDCQKLRLISVSDSFEIMILKVRKNTWIFQLFQ